MRRLKASKREGVVISAVRARANFGKLLSHVESQRGSLIIEKRGSPRAILLSIRDYVRLAVPDPEILEVLGQNSVRNGTDAFTSRQIDKIIRAARADRRRMMTPHLGR